MNYEELKSMKVTKQRELFTLNKKISSIEHEVSQANSMLYDLNGKKSKELENQRSKDLIMKIKQALDPIESEIRAKNSELSSLSENYLREKDSFSESSIMEDLKEKSPFSVELQEATEAAKEIINSDIGDRFANEYSRQLTTRKIVVSEEDMKVFIQRFGEIKEKMEVLSSSRKFDIGQKLENLLSDLSKNKFENNTKGAMMLFGVLTLSMVLLSWIVFPIYVGFICYTAVSNIRKGAMYSKLLLELKAITDNIEEYEDDIKKEASTRLSSKMEEVENKYKERKTAIEHEMDVLNRSLKETKSRVMDSFVFDSSSITKQFEIAESELLNKKKSLEGNLRQSQETVEKITNDLKGIEEELRKSVDDIRMKYLKLDSSDEKLLDYKFLLDIKDGQPIMFDYPKNSSCIFLYDSLKDVKALIKLMIVQLRARLSPHNLKINLWDQDDMGVEFLPFIKSRKELVKIFSNKEQFSDNLDEYTDLLRKRREIIRSQYPDIDSYNEAMISLDSLTESYSFLFIINLPEQYIDDETFHQLVSLGPSMGMYPIIFINKESLEESYVPFIKKCGKTFEIKNSEIKGRAETWVLETLIQFRK